MFRVTNRSAVFQMVWLQDVVKVTLQTFSPAVGLFKKNAAFLDHVTTLFLSWCSIYTWQRYEESPSAFWLPGISLATLVVHLKFPRIIINLALSFEERCLWSLKNEQGQYTRHSFLKKYQYQIQQNHNNETLEGGSSAQRIGDKSYLIQ